MQIPAQEMTAKLRHAVTTSTNDDLSKVGTVKRKRQIERIHIMLEAIEWIEQVGRKD